MSKERLQKLLAHAGLGSRRQVEQWIADGEVEVNGRVARLGERAGPGDEVRVRGRAVDLGGLESLPRRVLIYHKPEGEVTTRSDPEGRPTVFERLPRLEVGRWISVGRLDVNTSGLLLLTTDGELANRLMHPSSQVEREYAVRVFGEVDGRVLENLVNGVQLDDGPARFEEIVDSGGEGANRWYHVVILEGRKREVRRLWESQGLKVSRLIRVRYGPVILPPGLAQGRTAELTPGEVNELGQMVGLEPQKKPARAGGPGKRPGRPGRRGGRSGKGGPPRKRRR